MNSKKKTHLRWDRIGILLGNIIAALLIWFMLNRIDHMKQEMQQIRTECWENTEMQLSSDGTLYKECFEEVKVFGKIKGNKKGDTKKTTPQATPKPKKDEPKKPGAKPSTKTSALPSGQIDCDKVSRKDGTWTQNRILREACRKSGGDKDALLTLLTENPELDPTLISPPNHDGTTDHGLGQFNSYWHKDFIESKSFQYWDKQLDKFVSIFKERPTAFCAYRVRHRSIPLLVLGDA